MSLFETFIEMISVRSFLLSYSPTNTPRVFRVKATWKRAFSCRFNVEYTEFACRLQ